MTVLSKLSVMIEKQKEKIAKQKHIEPPIVTELTEEQKQRNYAARVSEYIREKYTIQDEIAILRQQNVKAAEYQEYYAYCEACKARAKAELQ